MDKGLESPALGNVADLSENNADFSQCLRTGKEKRLFNNPVTFVILPPLNRPHQPYEINSHGFCLSPMYKKLLQSWVIRWQGKARLHMCRQHGIWKYEGIILLGQQTNEQAFSPHPFCFNDNDPLWLAILLNYIVTIILSFHFIGLLPSLDQSPNKRASRNRNIILSLREER